MSCAQMESMRAERFGGLYLTRSLDKALAATAFYLAYACMPCT